MKSKLNWQTGVLHIKTRSGEKNSEKRLNWRLKKATINVEKMAASKQTVSKRGLSHGSLGGRRCYSSSVLVQSIGVAVLICVMGSTINSELNNEVNSHQSAPDSSHYNSDLVSSSGNSDEMMIGDDNNVKYALAQASSSIDDLDANQPVEMTTNGTNQSIGGSSGGSGNGQLEELIEKNLTSTRTIINAMNSGTISNLSGAPTNTTIWEASLLINGSITINSIIFVIGLCGNLMVILIILRYTRANSVTDIYILNLAFADLMFIIGLIFLIITMRVEHWIFGSLMCKIYMSSTSLNQFASSLLLAAMSFDRYQAICHPIYAQRCRNLKQAKYICLGVWILCWILMTPMLFYAKSGNQDTCAIVWPDYKTFSSELAFIAYSLTFTFAIPVVLISVFYISVLRRLRANAKQQLNSGSAKRSKSREDTNKRIERLVYIIIVTYGLCWAPYWGLQMYVSFSGKKDVTGEWGFIPGMMIATCLSYTNSAVNPILYAFLSDNFKRRCSEVIRSIHLMDWWKPTIYTKSRAHTTATNVDQEAGGPEQSQPANQSNESARLVAGPNPTDDRSTTDDNRKQKQLQGQQL